MSGEKQCNKCRNKLTKKCLQCDVCEEWVDFKCTLLDEIAYKAINKSDSHIGYICSTGCRRALALIRTVRNFEKSIEQMVNKKLKELDKEVKRAHERMDAFDEISKSFEDVPRSFDGDVSKAITEAVSEHMDEERRKNNLIIRGLKELPKAEEFELTEEIMKELDVFDENPVVEDIYRLGNKEDGRIRPLKVVMKSHQFKTEALGKAKNLRLSKKFSNVYVAPDLTKKQQEIDYNLRKELKERRENGEVDIMISKGKIVKRVTAEPPSGPRRDRLRSRRKSPSRTLSVD